MPGLVVDTTMAMTMTAARRLPMQSIDLKCSPQPYQTRGQI